MFDQLYILLAEMFERMKGENKEYWCLLKLNVPMAILTDLYEKFLRDGVEPIEKLSAEKKRYYFDISCKYYTTTTDRIKASKAAYVLELITSNV